MTPVFATVGPQHDGDLLMRILLLMLVVGQVVSLGIGIFGRRDLRRKIEPQPLEVVQGQQFMTRQESDLLHRSTDQHLKSIDMQIRELKQQRDADITALRSEMGGVRTDVAAIKAVQEGSAISLANLGAKLDRLLERAAAGGGHYHQPRPNDHS